MLTIIVPAYNEASSIRPVLIGLKSLFPTDQIIVINDASTDQTGIILSEIKDIQVIHHSRNRGYGGTWRTGVSAARTEYVAFFDGDGQFDPNDLKRLYEKISTSGADMVSGWRLTMSNTPIARWPGKWILLKFAQFLVGREIEDLNCGLRIFKRDSLKKYMHLLPLGFSASTTSLLLYLKLELFVEFEPIRIQKRSGSSQVRIIRDGLKTLNLMLRLCILIAPTRVFLPMALILIALAIVYSLTVALLYGNGLPILGAVFAVAGIQIFFLGILAECISTLRFEVVEKHY